MRYFIAGGGGMLGTDLRAVLSARDVTAPTSRELDIRDPEAVREAIAGHDVVINAAAYSRVDDAETDTEAAFAVNALGAENLALGAADAGARFVQLSTDYVFDGNATEPYPEDAALDPVNAYGRSKAEGERRATAATGGKLYIVRTAWLYGEHGPNFARTMLELAATRETVSVVTDQFGQPTWTVDLARQLVAMLDAEAPYGSYHGTNQGIASWFDFARAVFSANGLDPERVLPTVSAAFVRPAPRPGYSVLAHDGWLRAGLAPMRPWREALDAATATGVFGAP